MAVQTCEANDPVWCTVLACGCNGLVRQGLKESGRGTQCQGSLGEGRESGEGSCDKAGYVV